MTDNTSHEDDFEAPAGAGITAPEGTITNRSARRQEQLDRLTHIEPERPVDPARPLPERNRQAYQEEQRNDHRGR